MFQLIKFIAMRFGYLTIKESTYNDWCSSAEYYSNPKYSQDYSSNQPKEFNLAVHLAQGKIYTKITNEIQKSNSYYRKYKINTYLESLGAGKDKRKEFIKSLKG